MSEAKNNWWRQWENPVLLACTLIWGLFFASLGVHYATVTLVSEPGCCSRVRIHSIAGKRMPKWIDTHVFGLADDIDYLFRR
jgi:hypothetical protein